MDDPSNDELLDLLDLAVEAPPPGDPDETVLTKKDRRYLRGKEPDLSKSTERSRRGQLRKRLRNAWVDHAIAFEHISLEDSKQLLLDRAEATSVYRDHTDTDDDPIGPPELFWSYIIAGETPNSPVIGTGGLRQVFGLGCLSLYDALVEELGWNEHQYEELLEALVAGAIQDSLAKYGRLAPVNVTIDIEDGEDEELPAEIDTLDDLRMLYAHRAVEPEEFWNALDTLDGEI